MVDDSNQQLADGASEPSSEFLVRLNDKNLKFLDDIALETLGTDTLLSWLNTLDKALTAGFETTTYILRPEEKINNANLKGRANSNLTTVNQRFSALTENQPDPSSLYLAEAVIFAVQILQALAKRAQNFENLKWFSANYNTSLLNILNEVLGEKFNSGSNTLNENLDRTDYYQIINAIEEGSEVAKQLLQMDLDQKEREEKVVGASATSGQASQEKSDTYDDLFASGETTEETEGGEAEATTPQPDEKPAQEESKFEYSAPKDVLQIVLSKQFVQSAQQSGLMPKRVEGTPKTQEQRISSRTFVNESAWVTQGVIAQLYPEYIGRMNELPPEALTHIREAVIKAVGNQAGSGGLGGFSSRLQAIREATFASMRDLSTAGIQVTTPIAQREVGGELRTTAPTREELINSQLPEMENYLISQLKEQKAPIPDQETLRQLAYEQLTLAPTETLMAVALGVPLIREKVFNEVGKQVVTKITGQSITTDLVAQEATQRLTGYIAQRLSDGATAEEILGELEALPPQALADIVGVQPTAEMLAQIKPMIVEQATQKLITVFNANPGGKATISSRLATKSAAGAVLQISKQDDDEANAVSQAPHTSSSRKKTQEFLKHFQKSWSTLNQDEQIVVYLMAGLPVNSKLFESNPSLDPLPLPIEFIDYVQKTQTKEFQEHVQMFSKTRGAFKSPTQRERLVDSWKLSKDASAELAYLQEQLRIQAQEEYLAYQQLSKEAQEKLALVAGLQEAAEMERLLALRAAQAQQDAIHHANVFYNEMQAEDGQRVTQVFANPMADPDVATSLLAAENQEQASEAWGDSGVGGFAPQQVAEGAYKNKFVNPKGLMKGAFGKAAVLRKKLQKQGGQQLEKALGTFGGVWGKAAVLAKKVLGNKNVRVALGGLTLGILARFLHNTGTAAGATFSTAGGIAGGMALGPGGAIAGAYGGAELGGMVPEGWWNPRFFDARQPPSNFIGPQEAPMSYYREPSSMASKEAVGASTTQPAVSSVPPQAPIAPAAATAAGLGAGAVAAKAAGITTAILGPALMPALSLLGVAGMSMIVMLVIWGAFLVDTPIEPLKKDLNKSPEVVQENPYIVIKKTAVPQKIENNLPTQINYTISIESKLGFAVKIKSAKDEFSYYSDPKNASANSRLEGLQSPLDLTQFANMGENGLITRTETVQYSVEMKGEDAYVTNVFSVEFDVYNSTELAQNPQAQPTEVNQKSSAVAYVVIGNPNIGCWPTSGPITQLEWDYTTPGWSHSTSVYGSDALDIGQGSDLSIYATFPGRACGKDFSGYGKHVELTFPYQNSQLVLIFAHLSKFDNGLGNNVCINVAPETRIGWMGMSGGTSTGVHLHYELRKKDANGQAHPFRLRQLIIGGETIRFRQNVTSCYSNTGGRN